MAKNVKAKPDLPILIGLDVGFGNTKFISSVRPQVGVIPSMVVPGQQSSSKLAQKTKISLDDLIVTTEDGTYFVGTKAEKHPARTNKRTLNTDRANDEISRVLFQTLIGYGVPHEEGEFEVYVVTGLPNSSYNRSIAKNLEEFLKKPFEVEFHLTDEKTIKKKINVKGVEILRQPEGTTTNTEFSFDPKTFILLNNAREKLGVADIGHFTTDYALFLDGLFVEDDEKVCNSTVAVQEMIDILKPAVVSKFDNLGLQYDPKEEDLEKIVRNKKLFYYGQEHDFTEEVDSAAKEVAKRIFRAITEAWSGEINRLEAILITGGGAIVFQEHLKKLFEDQKILAFTVVDQPQFANVLGFYKYGAIALTTDDNEQDIYEEYIEPVFAKEGSDE